MDAAEKSADHLCNNFNLLRLILASLVIFSHAPVLLDGDETREPLRSIFHTLTLGEIAVDGFFLLSGYLIVKSWVSDPDPLNFLKKRILRIYPGFILASLISAFVVGPLGAADVVQYFAQFPTIGYLKTVVLLRIPEVPRVFAGNPHPAVNGSMWTIAFEFLCYLLVLGMGTVGALKSRVVWGVCTCIALALLALRGFHAVMPGGIHLEHESFRLVPIFFLGGCYYFYRDRIVFKHAVAACLAVVFCAAMYDARIAEFGAVVAGSYLLFFFALARIRALAWFNRLPDVSYGVYLYAWPVKKLLIWYVPTISLPALLIGSLTASVALGVASWKIVEEPFLKLKGRRMPLPAGRTAT